MVFWVATHIIIYDSWTSDRAAFPLITKITSSGKTPVGHQCPECYFSKFLHASAKNLRTYRVVCAYFEAFYFELLDPDILSGLHNFLNIYQQDYLRDFWVVSSRYLQYSLACVFSTLTRLLCTRRHPAHPVSVLILHPGSTTEYVLLDSATEVQRVRCSVCLWDCVLLILHYWDDHLSYLLHYGLRKFSTRCRRTARWRQPRWQPRDRGGFKQMQLWLMDSVTDRKKQ